MLWAIALGRNYKEKCFANARTVFGVADRTKQRENSLSILIKIFHGSSFRLAWNKVIFENIQDR